MKKNKLYIIITFIFLFNIQAYGSQVWKSMIMPGWGEKGLNENKRANALLFSEYAMWALFIFSNDQYSSYRNDYRNHGEHYAGVDWLSKNDLYAANVGNFTCLSYDDCGDEAYNVIKAQNFLWDDKYPEGEGYEWNWENRNDRLKYDTWRNKSKNYDEAKGFLIAGMFINRIISVIDVFILERKSKISSDFSYSSQGSNLKIYYKF